MVVSNGALLKSSHSDLSLSDGANVLILERNLKFNSVFHKLIFVGFVSTNRDGDRYIFFVLRKRWWKFMGSPATTNDKKWNDKKIANFSFYHLSKIVTKSWFRIVGDLAYRRQNLI